MLHWDQPIHHHTARLSAVSGSIQKRGHILHDGRHRSSLSETGSEDEDKEKQMLTRSKTEEVCLETYVHIRNKDSPSLHQTLDLIQHQYIKEGEVSHCCHFIKQLHFILNINEYWMTKCFDFLGILSCFFPYLHGRISLMPFSTLFIFFLVLPFSHYHVCTIYVLI